MAAACTSSSPVEADSTAELAVRASKFEVAPVQIDLGTTGTSASITLKNNSNRKLSWNAAGYRSALVPAGLPSTKEWICYAGEELTRTR